jgi:carboxylesterase
MREVFNKKGFRRFLVWIIILGIISIFLYGWFSFFSRTGVLGIENIDKADLKRTEYDSEGIMVGARAFELEGNKEVCWLMIHGYAATPDVMKEISGIVNAEFGDYIKVIRLKGHGEVPSKILNLDLYDWHEQVEKEFFELEKECGSINVVGSSYGGALSLKLAEEHELGNVYVANPYLRNYYKKWMILPTEFYIEKFADWIVFITKNKAAQINDPVALEKHLMYISMPLQPVKNSIPFVKEVKKDLNRITENIVTFHSYNDVVADYVASEWIFEDASSEIKEKVLFTESNHVLLVDYDKQEVFNKIVSFEKENRK